MQHQCWKLFNTRSKSFDEKSLTCQNENKALYILGYLYIKKSKRAFFY